MGARRQHHGRPQPSYLPQWHWLQLDQQAATASSVTSVTSPLTPAIISDSYTKPAVVRFPLFQHTGLPRGLLPKLANDVAAQDNIQQVHVAKRKIWGKVRAEQCWGKRERGNPPPTPSPPSPSPARRGQGRRQQPQRQRGHEEDDDNDDNTAAAIILWRSLLSLLFLFPRPANLNTIPDPALAAAVFPSLTVLPTDIFLRAEIGRLSAEIKRLRHRKAESDAEKEDIAAEKEDLAAENVNFAAQNRRLAAENRHLAAKNRRLAAENRRLSAEKERPSAEETCLRAEKVERILGAIEENVRPPFSTEIMRLLLVGGLAALFAGPLVCCWDWFAVKATEGTQPTKWTVWWVGVSIVKALDAILYVCRYRRPAPAEAPEETPVEAPEEAPEEAPME